MIGIDLALKNCGVYNSSTKESFVIGSTSLGSDDILDFSKILANLVTSEVVVVDFDLQKECYYPGNKRQTAMKYFLAGVIKGSAEHCFFLSASEVRSAFGLAPKTSKKEFHRFFYDNHFVPFISHNEHILDAFILVEAYERIISRKFP